MTEFEKTICEERYPIRNLFPVLFSAEQSIILIRSFFVEKHLTI